MLDQVTLLRALEIFSVLHFLENPHHGTKVEFVTETLPPEERLLSKSCNCCQDEPTEY